MSIANIHGKNAWVQCSFDAAVGAATVPADVLRTLSAGAGDIGFETTSDANLPDGAWNIAFHASYAAVWPGDSGREVTWTLQ